MKHKITLMLTILSLQYICAQAPAITWQKTLGGLNYDGAESILPTPDGGYIMAGWSNSTDPSVSGNHGESDYWVVKTDADGNVAWEKSFGGSGTEEAYSIQIASDGGYVVAGYTLSNNGNVTGNHGFVDFWVVKLDTAGTMQWQHTYGGSGLDRVSAMETTADGGYVLAGFTNSNNGDVAGNHGAFDYWVLKLDAAGTLQWQKCLGGSFEDSAKSIRPTSDGGYIVAGQTSSTDGDVIGSHGNNDYWVVKLDAAGSIQWQKTLGGSGNDIAYDIQTTSDGGYVVAGASNSVDGDVTGNHGISDYWVAKLDAAGTIQWQKSYGGSGDDGAYVIETTPEGGYVIAGYGSSADGDETGHHGNGDYWVLRLDSTGAIQWQQSLGGSDLDRVASIRLTSDGGYILAGYTQSNDGDVTLNHGVKDYWLVKLSADGLATAVFDKETIVIYPNPADVILQFQTPNNTSITKIKISDVTGKIVLERNQINSSINIEKLANGMYILEATSGENVYRSKFMKK